MNLSLKSSQSKNHRGVFLHALRALPLRCQHGHSPSWLTLRFPMGWQSQGMSPGPCDVSFWVGTDLVGGLQGQLKEQKVGQSRCPCLEGILSQSPSAELWQGAAWPPPTTGINSHLSQLFLHLEVSQYLLRSQKQTQPHLNSAQEPSCLLLGSSTFLHQGLRESFFGDQTLGGVWCVCV